MGSIPILKTVYGLAGDFDPQEKPETLMRTNSKARFYRHQKFLIKNPELQMGSATFKFGKEGLVHNNKVLKQENASKIKIPVRIFEAEDDIFVQGSYMRNFSNMLEDCVVETIKSDKVDTRHELYFEVDSARRDLMNRTFSFLNSKLT